MHFGGCRFWLTSIFSSCNLIFSSDVDECQPLAGCAQRCHNTDGSYTCSCNDGYTLNSDERNCDGMCYIIVQQSMEEVECHLNHTNVTVCVALLTCNIEHVHNHRLVSNFEMV